MSPGFRFEGQQSLFTRFICQRFRFSVFRSRIVSVGYVSFEPPESGAESVIISTGPDLDTSFNKQKFLEKPLIQLFCDFLMPFNCED
jgi:hypothetical protein